MRRAEDVDLLARASEGDRIAFAALYDRYAPRLYGLALRIVGRGSDADDVLQQTWMQVWEQARSYDPSKASVGAWLVVRLRSRALDALRRRRARPDESRGAPAPDGASSEPAPGDAVEQRVESTRIGAAVAGLRDEYRRVLELAYFEGRTQVEIAALLQVPLGSVKTWTRRGLQALRQRLEGSTGR